MSPSGLLGDPCAAGLRLIKLSSLVMGFQPLLVGMGLPNLLLPEPALLLQQSRDVPVGNSHVGWLWHVQPLVPRVRVLFAVAGTVRLPLPLLAPLLASQSPAVGRKMWSHPQPGSPGDPIPGWGASHSCTGRGQGGAGHAERCPPAGGGGGGAGLPAPGRHRASSPEHSPAPGGYHTAEPGLETRGISVEPWGSTGGSGAVPYPGCRGCPGACPAPAALARHPPGP